MGGSTAGCEPRWIAERTGSMSRASLAGAVRWGRLCQQHGTLRPSHELNACTAKHMSAFAAKKRAPMAGSTEGRASRSFRLGARDTADYPRLSVTRGIPVMFRRTPTVPTDDYRAHAVW